MLPDRPSKRVSSCPSLGPRTATSPISGPCKPCNPSTTCAGHASRVGRLCRAAIRRSPPRPQLPGPLHAPCCYLEQPAAQPAGHVLLEGLQARSRAAHDDARCRRVHPALPAARSAERAAAHPALRLPRQPLPANQARAVSPTPARTGATDPGVQRQGRLPRPLPEAHRQIPTRLPTVRQRTHGLHRDLGGRTMHARAFAAGVILMLLDDSLIEPRPGSSFGVRPGAAILRFSPCRSSPRRPGCTDFRGNIAAFRTSTSQPRLFLSLQTVSAPPLIPRDAPRLDSAPIAPPPSRGLVHAIFGLPPRRQQRPPEHCRGATTLNQKSSA
jgi:hypothetical protein